MGESARETRLKHSWRKRQSILYLQLLEGAPPGAALQVERWQMLTLLCEKERKGLSEREGKQANDYCSERIGAQFCTSSYVRVHLLGPVLKSFTTP